MEGPFETAAPYDAPRDDADRWQAPIMNVGVLSNQTQADVSSLFVPPPQQQQPAMQQLEQQQQMRRAEDLVEAPVQKTREQLQREYEKALAWVKVYEPDRLW
jgi:hypothetical protein